MNIQPQTRTPPLSSDAAHTLLSDIFGLSGLADRLPSEVDDTFRITGDDGKRYTLKVAGVNERSDVLRFQTDAMLHLAEVAPGLPVPRALPARNGETIVASPFDGEERLVRLLSWLDGTPLHAAPGSIAQMQALGHSLGALDRGLERYAPKVPQFDLIWDIGRAKDVAKWADEIEDPALRALTQQAFARAAERGAQDVSLPHQVIHNDINPHNIIVDAADPDRISGIIDFGDLIYAPRINDLAIALSYQLGKDDGLARTAALIAGYRSEVVLTADEGAALLPKILARLAMTIAITTHRAAANPGHATYILRNRPISIAGLERLAALPTSAWAALLEGHPA